MSDPRNPAAGDAAKPVAETREQALAQALADFSDLQARDETVDLKTFCARYPELQPELHEQLRAFLDLDRPAGSNQPPPSPATEPLPERLSGHKILGEIGRGGMGRVLLAVDEPLNRKVAIKTLNRFYANDQSVRARFMQEARAMARLSHPNVVPIYSLGRAEEPAHFVMEYLDGKPLTEAAAPLHLAQKVELMHQVVLAVDYLHRQHMIHRDLKPANILVGADLKPKLLDFGLALQASEFAQRLTRMGEVVGTPHYFSPEQARADAPLDARSDVFSLGTILYELLTGELPFQQESFSDQVRSICEQQPVLPRRLNPAVPGDLQNICMKALEKLPARRYASARQMADDLERFLAGEKVLADPSVYTDLIAGKIDQHLHELEGWQKDEILSVHEYDSLRRGYERLIEREDAWIMEVRRLSLAQVSLYLGAWVLVVGAALVFLFRYPGLTGTSAVLVVAGVALPTGWFGLRLWKEGRRRIAVAYLLAFCLLVPITILVAMGEYKVAASFTRGDPALEIFQNAPESFKSTTNAQLWWAIALALPVYFWLRRFTQSSVYSLVLAVMCSALSAVTLLRLGLLKWLEEDPGKLYFRLLPIAALFFFIGYIIERRGHRSDSRYFYPVAVFATFIGLSGLALYHAPWQAWLARVAPWTRGQLEYLFIINAGIYLLLQLVLDRFPWAQVRNVARAFRFLLPGHVMTSLLLLGLKASELWAESPADVSLHREARVFEFLLPAVACAFVFGSIPKQMKNFFVTGILFLAIGVVRLQQNYFKDRVEWPLLLLVAGVLLMIYAASHAKVKFRLARQLRRFSSMRRPPDW